MASSDPTTDFQRETVLADPTRAGDVRVREAEDRVPAIWRTGDVILDLYEVKEILGEGGMGTVYLVHHKGWGVDLAVKSPKPKQLEQTRGVPNFVREAETWVRLGLHPNIVSCYYVRTLGGIPRVFAEYVQSGTLAAWISLRKLYDGGPQAALERIIDIAIQFAWGLDYAHEQGLVHQDVKPANVMMAPDGTAKVTDFGLARTRAQSPALGQAVPGDSAIASSGGMTPAYASPEQTRGDALTRKTDVWSWGVSVLEMFTGRLAEFAGTAAAQALRGYLDAGPDDRELPRMPQQIAALLARCFSEDPHERPHSMGEIAAYLQEQYQNLSNRPYPRSQPKASELTADSHNNKALSMFDLGKHKEAEAAWLSALQSDAQHADATYNYGLMRWRRGEITDEQLVQQLEEVRKSHGNTWYSKFLLARVHMERADMVSARPLLEEAVRVAPGESGIQTSLDLLNSHKFVPGRHLRAFREHRTQLTAVCFSSDGRDAIAGGGGDVARIWDMASGNCIRTIPGDHPAYVILSSDGRYALAGTKEYTGPLLAADADSYRLWEGDSLQLWDIETGRCVRTIQFHRSCCSPVHLNADGRYAFLSSKDNVLRLWELETDQCLRKFDGHTDQVRAICISRDGRYALSGGDDIALRLWDVATGCCLRTLEGHAGRVTAVCFSPDGRYALSGSWDLSLLLWDVESGRCLRTFKGHIGPVTAACFSADGRFALSGSQDYTVRFWEIETGRCMRTLRMHTGHLSAVSLSQNGRYALSGACWGVTLQSWLCPSGAQAGVQLSRLWSTSQTTETNVQMSELLGRAKQAEAEAKWLIAAEVLREARALPGKARAAQVLEAWAGLSMRCRRGRLRDAWHERSFEGHSDSVFSSCLSPDGKYALSGSRDNSLRLWDVASGRCIRTLDGHNHWVRAVCLSLDGRYALSGSLDRTVRLWELASGRCMRTLEGHANGVISVALSDDGRFALSGDDRASLRLWEVNSGRHLRTLRGSTMSISLTPHGYALSAGPAGLQLWELMTGHCVRIFKPTVQDFHPYMVRCSPDGRHALTGSIHGKLQFWDIATGEFIREFAHAQTGQIHSVGFTPDGRYAVSGSELSKIHIWEIESGQCLRALEGHTSNVFSACFSADGHRILSGSGDRSLRLWYIDWDLEPCDSGDWHEGALPYLESFLTLHTPYVESLPKDRQLQAEAVNLALSRRGVPSWTGSDFESLLDTLGHAGFGWLRPRGVEEQLNRMAKDWKVPTLLET